MKRFIFSLSVLVATSFLLSNCTNRNSKSKTVEIPDENIVVDIPDANFKAYLLENFDANKDGNISLAEAKTIKSIDCSGKSIQKLDGIEKFENLEFLNCSNNQLNELELRYNKKLDRLICNDNNTDMFIYIGLSSLIRDRNVIPMSENEAPTMGSVPRLDLSKCVFDPEKTNIALSQSD